MKEKGYAGMMSAISLILKVIGLIIGIAALFLLAWKVFGNSPASESIIIAVVSSLTALVCANIALTFKIVYKLGRMETDTKNIKGTMHALARDFRKHQQH